MTALPNADDVHPDKGLDPSLSYRHACVSRDDGGSVNRLAVARQRREAARARDLAILLRERPELEGVYGLADFAVTSIRWCA